MRLSLRYLWFLPAFIEMVAIWTFSAIPEPPAPAGWLDSDKLLHMLAYGVLAGLFFPGFYQGMRMKAERSVLWCMVCSAGFGLLDEIHQGFTPGRHQELGDIIANTVGAVLAGGIILFVIRSYKPYIRSEVNQ